MKLEKSKFCFIIIGLITLTIGVFAFYLLPEKYLYDASTNVESRGPDKSSFLKISGLLNLYLGMDMAIFNIMNNEILNKLIEFIILC